MAEMELAHAIGFSGTADRPMHVEADGDGVVLASGGTIILGSLSDPHRQRFLRGHNGAVSCLASSPSFVVSGQSGGDPDVVVGTGAPAAPSGTASRSTTSGSRRWR